MGLLKVLSILFLFSSCAKVGYLLDQANGQLKILKDAKENKVLLKDPKVSSEVKRKIHLIMAYKKFFYDFFNRKDPGIYSKTYILPGDAVTHLLIASKYDEIKPKMFGFPLVGDFPYIGFFEIESAKKWANKLKANDYVTYIRPVYAYSTIGYFEDRILSSFFKYSDHGLAELIFHELFHTIFFIKDEVSLNENLANLFGKEMASLYYKLNSTEQNNKLLKKSKQSKLREKIVSQVQELKKHYGEKSLTRNEAKKVLSTFLEKSFKPTIEKTCKSFQIKDCWPLRSAWNNARFAAFLTYEKKQDFLKDLKGKQSLMSFYNWLKKSYQNYLRDDKNKASFSDYLKSL